jgi:hypothetical protein
VNAMPYDTHVSTAMAGSSLIVTASIADDVAVQTDDLLAPIIRYADLGARGGLSGAAFNPGEAKVGVVAAELSADGRVRWHLSAERIAPDAIDMLLGSVGFIDAKVAPLREVTVEAPRALGVVARQSSGGYYRPTPFRLVDERSFQSKGFQIDVHFAGAPPATVVDEIESTIGSWIAAANAGCFSSRSVPVATSHVYPGDARHGDDVLVLPLEDVFVSEPDATHSLVNVLHWAHWHVAPIVHVELYE